MKRLLILFVLPLLFAHCRKKCGTLNPKQVYYDCVPAQQLSETFLPTEKITDILEKYVERGLPGITFLARKGEQYWEAEQGIADRKKNRTIKSCMVWPGYSITQMYTATVILKLKEEGRINLDKPIAGYLPAHIVARVPGAAKITVRHLLNHSSGIENFWNNSRYISGYLDDPKRSYTVNDYLDAAQERLFEPGTDAGYSNTNYLLLALIIDQVTGKPHQQAYERYIMQPLSLTGTYYKQLPAIQMNNNSPKLYADTDGEGELTDYTDNSFIQFKNEFGSNGILATPKNYVDFLYALSHAKVLANTTFNEMKTWVRGRVGLEVYGLGFEKFNIEGKEVYGHSGNSFGGRMLLVYAPEKELAFFIGVNAGAEFGGPVLIHFAHLIADIVAVLIK
ncbi:serine hydrolase domain-containing protein [Terrimonas rubra]|uniref:Serine hydrolase domain-containing protein n=1 Tax=Terrimonas rubra TaxID=1035890 RepID=A0ABW6AA86_9BACT